MFEEFLKTITKWNVIVGLIIAILALALLLSAKPIVKKIYKDKTENDRANFTMALKIVAAGLALVGCILVMFINI